MRFDDGHDCATMRAETPDTQSLLLEHPLAVVILGGLVTSTILNLFIVPSLYLKFGRSAVATAKESI